MDAMVDLLLVSLAVSVQLGVPVVVLFVAGFLSHRGGKGRWVPRGPLDEPTEPATAPTAAKRGQAPDDVVGPSLEFRRCQPPDPARSSLPCWQAVKTDRGRLRSECLDCRLFLTPARRG